MTPALLALAAAALLVCARADKSSDVVILTYGDGLHDRTFNKEPSRSLPSNLRAVHKSVEPSRKLVPNDVTHNDSAVDFHHGRPGRAYSPGKNTELPSSCLYGGRWHEPGSVVSTREDCLLCVCGGGALTCRRRACAPLPEPLPSHCHVRHRRGFCCPELVCPDGVQLMEHGAIARFNIDDLSPGAGGSSPTPATAKNACVEGGSVFAAGSALAARVPCEQCFCLRGARRCVRPACLPPPPHCAPRPAPGACCPQRYYCDSSPDKPNQNRNRYDCQVNGEWVPEGSPVASSSNCTTCFCLHGEVRCQAMGCAPALAGCRPLLAPGECCAHQYVCDHNDNEHHSHGVAGSVNSPVSIRYDKRTFHSSKLESTTKKLVASQYTLKHIASATKNHLITTIKVKRKTDEPPLNASVKPEQNTNATSSNITTTQDPISIAKLIAMSEDTHSEDSPEKTTEQPDGTVKIMINGTINCTAELSSTSIPLSIVANDTDNISVEVMPRVPIVNVEAQTYSPNDIITDRNVNGGFDEDDTFTINVTSSLMTNTSRSTSRPVMTAPKLPADLAEALNSSKKQKGEYDYDYTEPTLPPSLPNLKIIPFVAADAVVDDEPTKDTYPILEREDKFPVYYPTADTKETKYPVRREDTYQPTQYPVFMMGNVEPSYPPMSHEVDVPRDSYPERNDLGVHEYTVSASLGSPGSDMRTVTVAPLTSTTFDMETPAVNLFSPPVETEGGFLPKGAGVLEEYFGVYPSTPSGPAVPHLTTSMQLNIVKDVKGECLAEGRHVPSGQSIVLGCQLCTCAWDELVCERRPCAPAAPPCHRLPLSNHSRDPCCGDVDCPAENNITSTKAPVERESNKENDIKVEVTNSTSESSAAVAITNKTSSVNTNATSTTAPLVNSEPVQKTSTTAVPPTTPSKATTKLTTTTTTTTTITPISQAHNTSLEEEEDEDDGGFSFGSVLQLLLSDSYEATTAPSKKKTQPPTRPTHPTPPVRRVTNSAPSTNKPEMDVPFKPLPSHPQPFIFNLMPPSTVNRIDHLVLGEATAIKRTTHRPVTDMTSTRAPPQTHERPTSQMYDTTEQTAVPQEKPFTPIVSGGPRPPSLGSLPGSGILKVAGCNIYGMMYRVGRIILELSTPCQECWCTEQGVQCKSLTC